MKLKQKYSCLLYIFLLVPFISNAQVWNLRIGAGTSSYAGDLTSAPISFDNSHPAIRAGVGMEITPRLAIEASFFGGRVSGSDENKVIDPTRVSNFRSTIYSYDLLIKYRIKKMDIHNSKLGVAMLFGGGVFNFDSREDVGGTTIILAEAMRENTTYSTTPPAALIGLELSYPISRKLIISLQSVYHYTFTDYLDDISLRKNPNDNDSFLDNTVSVIYRFGKDCEFLKLIDPLACPAFLR